MIPPFATISTWISVPTRVLNAFAGKSSLPVVELEKQKVLTARAHTRPFPEASGKVAFSAWRLAHAIKKADCSRLPTTSALWTGATGFLLENGHLFDWGNNELTLHKGMSDYYADFTGSGLAGRVAQGMALLFLEEKGYAYVGRFETEWKQRAATQNKSWPKDKKQAPDFIAENERKEWILAESKGGFASPDSRPNIKGALSEGLEQLKDWDKYITPQPTKSFAIGTFLRESGDTSKETSMIAFVDPEPEAPENPVEFPTDAVRRANYGSWLLLMGFEDAAARVKAGSGEPQQQIVPTIALGGRKFVVRVASMSPGYSDLSSREFWDNLRDWPFFHFRSPTDGFRLEVIGLDLKVFEALSDAAAPQKSSDLMELKPQKMVDTPLDFDGGAFYGSVFSDGSLLGELRQNRIKKLVSVFEWIEVNL